jgi:hypothetical protein
MTAIIKQVATRGGGHKYQVENDPRVDPAKLLKSCSGIASYSDNSSADGLIYWGIHAYRKTQKIGAFRDLRDEAMKIGSGLHAEIHKFIATGDHPDESSILYDRWFDDMASRGITWENWRQAEMPVYYADSGGLYGGTIDAIGEDQSGVMTLWDWKTTSLLDSKGNPKKLGSASHAAQVAGYYLALQTMLPEDVPDMPTQAIICYICKDTGDIIKRPINLEKACRAFAACLSLFRVEGELYE